MTARVQSPQTNNFVMACTAWGSTCQGTVLSHRLLQTIADIGPAQGLEPHTEFAIQKGRYSYTELFGVQ